MVVYLNKFYTNFKKKCLRKVNSINKLGIPCIT
jgi:hypothetical protein